MMESIEGIGNVYVQETEYFSTAVLNAFVLNVAKIKTILDKSQDASYTPSAADYDDLIATIQNLGQLATNGVSEGNPQSPFTSYLNSDMADHLQDIMQYMKIIGISTSTDTNIPDSEKIEKIQQWQNLAGFGLQDLLTQTISLYASLTQVSDPQTGTVISVTSTNRTLQSLVETEYIRQANELLGTKLNSLQTQLDVTSNILTTLEGIQNIMNSIQVSAKTGFTLSGITDFRSQYSGRASAYFSQIYPSAVLTSGPGLTAAVDLYRSKQRLSSLLTQLETLEPANNRNVANTLAANIFAVMKDISAQFNTVSYVGDKNALLLSNSTLFESIFKNGVKEWILDGMDKPITNGDIGDAGAIQGRIFAAVSTAENVNDQQKDDVRRYMQIFQEFYKSAAKILEFLTESIEKLGQNLSKK